MAFASGGAKYPCQLCGEYYTWMKMMFSANPRTHGFVTMGLQTQATAAEALETNELTNEPVERCLKKRRVCPDCEVTWRLEVQSTHPEGSFNPDWSSKSAVVQAMKKVNKGHLQWEKAIHWNAACRMTENQPNYNKLSKEDKSQETKPCIDHNKHKQLNNSEKTKEKMFKIPQKNEPPKRRNEKETIKQSYAKLQLPLRKHPNMDGQLHHMTPSARRMLKLRKEHRRRSYTFSAMHAPRRR